MKHPTLSLLGVLAGFALCGSLTAHAQDKATLDLLVKKGTITQAEADAALKANAASLPVQARNTAVKKLQITGRIHIQYDYNMTEDKAGGASNPPAVSQFLLRRVYLGAILDLGNGWGGEAIMDFAAGAGAVGATGLGNAQAGIATRNNFDKVIISKTITDYGQAAVGYQKVQYVLEENTSSSEIKTVERSVATRYFSETYGGPTSGNLGFGNRHVGAFWNGTIKDVPGLGYGVAVANGVQSTTSFGNAGGLNQLSFWGNVSYTNKYDALSYKVGFNLGYSMDGNDTTFVAGGGANAAAQGNYIWGFNPYVTLTYDAFTLTGEFIMTQVQNGRSTAPNTTSAAAYAAAQFSDAWPYGFNLIPSYKINDQWELVARFSYLATNGRGTNISSVERNAANTTGPGNVGLPAGVSSGLFDSVWAAYFGFNYYIIGNSLKLTAGYEFAQFDDRTGGGTAGQLFSGPRANVNSFRMRLQLLF